MLRHWLNRSGFQRTAVLGLVLGVAWVTRQTQGAFVYELYYYLTQPLRLVATPPQWVNDARSLEMQQRLIELENQNRQLQQLLGEVGQLNAKAVPAPVIGRTPDYWWQQITLGRGERQGIRVGAPVSGIGGVIGRVIDVTPNTSRVLLITDPNSSLGVMISGRGRSQGYIRGQTQEEVVMHFLDKDPDVKLGDVVVTSSVSTLFPAGLPVGVVQSVDTGASPVPQAKIRLSAPISRLEWVTVSP